MKKYRIAFCGVFDLANYGDHIFPIIFSNEMDKRGLNHELILFSPIECQKAFDDSIHVYSLHDLEKMQIENPFDVFVIAGGEIVHLLKFFQRLNDDEKSHIKYPISEIWLIPSIVANKYGIKLIWNAPGIPFKFEDSLKPIVKSICECADYLSVRNTFSKECLIECDINEDRIQLVPDTVLNLSKTVNIDYLMEIREKLLPFTEKYIVFHSNKCISENQIECVIKSLNNLVKQGYKIVLLPLAYTHDDDITLSNINKLSNNKYFEFENSLSIFEMMSVLAGCFLYIGVSFHGAITALQYGKKAIAFDFMKNDKTKNLFEYLNIQNNYTTTEQNLDEVILNAIKCDNSVNFGKPELELKKHFDNIYTTIVNLSGVNIDNSNFVFNVATGITEYNIELSELKKNIKEKLEGLEWYRNHDGERQKYVDLLQNQVKIQENGLEWHRNQDEDRQKYIEQLKKQIEEQRSGLEWHRNQDEDRQKYIEQLEKQIEVQKNGLEWHRNQDEISKKYIDELISKYENEKLKNTELYAKIFKIENSITWKFIRALGIYKE